MRGQNTHFYEEFNQVYQRINIKTYPYLADLLFLDLVAVNVKCFNFACL